MSLFICGTPIGNLEDASQRLLRVLGQVDLILAEDTRVTRKLLSRYGISKPLLSSFKGNEASRCEEVVGRMLAGESCALVSDSGMPTVSDPGSLLVRRCAEEGITVEVVPGPSAVTAAAALSGLTSEGFVFLGFLPRKKSERITKLSSVAGIGLALIIYESPNRTVATLRELAAALGRRQAVVARELTKLYEETLRDTLDSLAEIIATRIAEPGEKPFKGEVTIVVSGAPGEADSNAHSDEEAADELRARALQLIEEEISSGSGRRQAVKKAATRFGIPANDLYRLSLGKR